MQVTKVKAAYVTTFAILIGFGLSAMVQTLAWEQAANLVAQSWQTLSELNALREETWKVDDAVRQFSARFSSPAAAVLRDELGRMVELEKRANARTGAAKNVVWQELTDAVALKAAALGGALNSSSTQALAAAQRAWESSAGPQRLVDILDRARQDQTRLIEQRTSTQADILARTRQLFSAAGSIAVLLILVTAFRVTQDSRRRNEVEKTLAAREEQYRQVVEQAGDIIYRTGPDGRFTFVNHAAISLLHLNEPEVISRSYLKLVRPDYRRQVARIYLRQLARRRKNSYLEFPVVDGHGRTRWLGQNVQILMEGGKVVGYQGIARDITERRRAEADLEKSRAFVERIALTTPGLLYVFDLVEKRNVFSNREIAALLGFGQEELQNRPDVLELVHPDDRPAVNGHHEALRTALDGEVRRLEYRMRHADGHWIWLLGRDTPFERDSNGSVRQIVGIAQDVTARRAAQERLVRQANFDALTGLANRHHFWTCLQSTLRRVSLAKGTASLCLFDIDNFKDINDRCGHAGGDEVLEAIGSIVRTELRSSDVAGRLGGDEFCLVLPNTDRDEAARVAERIRDRLITQAFGVTTGSPFTVTATFGVAEWQPQLETREVMEAADRALYRAKSAGRNRVCVDA